MTDRELVAYYKNLLIIQYRDKIKAGETLDAVLSELIIFELFEQIKYILDIEIAEGEVLDILSIYNGAKRDITGKDFTRLYFGFIDYDNPDPPFTVAGFTDYSEENVSQYPFYSYDLDSSVLFRLNDSELRILMRFCAFISYNDCSLKDINDFLELWFPAASVIDNENMTLVYKCPESVQYLLSIIAVYGKVPHPVGVDVKFVIE